MSEWSTASLGDIAEIRFSNVDKKDAHGDLPFMEASATRAEIERFRVEKGDVLVTKDSETPDDIGIPAVVADEIDNLVCGYHLALIKPDRGKVDSVYLAKQLASRPIASYFSRLANGSTRYGLSSSAIASTNIAIAPRPQQRRIAEILSTLDETIEQTEALIAKYQQIKAGLMHDLFTRGVTPDGKLRPARSEAPQLYKESPLGWIPKEWEVAALSREFSVSSGESLSEVDRKPGEYRVYGGNGPAGTHESYLFEEPRLIIGRVGEYCGNPYVTEARSWVTDNALVATFNRRVPRLQFWRMLLHRIDLRRFAYAAAQPVVTGGQLAKVMHPVIGEDEQRLIEDRVTAIEQFSEEERLHLLKLRQQKHGLMHDLLTGRVRVKVAD
jgi:type I restriction enzyme S subunit